MGGQKGFEVVPAGGTNLIVRVPATPGRESAPIVILQGHVDMVCERRPDSPYDPAEGRIKLLRDGEWLTADGTTLGADDGIAIVSMMAIAEDATVAHGPLEMLMTMAEEVGLEGAKSIDGSTLSGRMLLNLDSEEDGRLTVGCAGSTDTFLRVEGERGRWPPGTWPSPSPRAAAKAVIPAPTSKRAARTPSRWWHGPCARPRHDSLPPRLAGWRQEQERHPPRCRRRLCRGAGQADAFRQVSRRLRTHRRRLQEHRPRCTTWRSSRPTCRPMPGRTKPRAPCST